jgi:tetratricopeptide (TPR) repeat protein
VHFDSPTAPSSVLALALALAPAVTAAVPSRAVSDGDGERVSLEGLAEHYGAQRDRMLAELRGQVTSLMSEMDQAARVGARKDLERLGERLRALGPGCAPLLLAYLDPGLPARGGELLPPHRVALVLASFPAHGVTEELLAMLTRGSPEGRRNALTVLEKTRHPERVGPAIRALVEGELKSLHEPALLALARIGGADNERFLGERLLGEDLELARLALEAATLARSTGLAGKVRILLASHSAGAPLALPLAAYFTACEEVGDEEVCTALLDLARDSRTSSEGARALVDLLARLRRHWDSKLKKALKGLTASSDRALAESALVALTLAGDRAARHELLEPYDDRIESQEDWALVWEERAAILYRIEDFKGAIKDYREALATSSRSSRPMTDDYVGVARCFARMGKLKDAAKWLEGAPLSYMQRRALAEDPVFAELAAHPRYREEVFRLDD